MLSFIIPAYNEESVIGRTLVALRASACAAGEPFEVIVVDDGSEDRTGEIASEYGARVIRVERRQISAVRNAGARIAHGELLVFVDADTIVPESALRAAVGAWRAGAVGGGSAVRFGGHVPLYARLILPHLILAFRLLRLATGCFLFCRREVFDAVGGYDESLFASEEIALSMALNRRGRFVVVPQAVITSGRKLRQYSAVELLWTMTKLAAKGPWACREREGLEIWYDGRREASHGDSSPLPQASSDTDE